MLWVGKESIPAATVAIVVAAVSVVGHMGRIRDGCHALDAFNVRSGDWGVGVAGGERDNGGDSEQGETKDIHNFSTKV